MLSLALPQRIYLCLEPADMRKSIDGLAGLVQLHLSCDPLAGDLFVFRSKRGDRLKLLYWQEDGFCLWYKRLEAGTFVFPTPACSPTPPDDAAVRVGGQGLAIRPADLAMLLDGVDLSTVQRRPRYRRPTPAPAPPS